MGVGGGGTSTKLEELSPKPRSCSVNALKSSARRVQKLTGQSHVARECILSLFCAKTAGLFN